MTKGDGDVIKHPKDQTIDETTKASYDLKARNILISTLSVKIFYSISDHKSADTVWNALQTLYEGTENVKDYKIDMLTQEFDVFHMEPKEFVESMQTHFFYLINKLNNLEIFISNKDRANKILRSICKEWKPKVTAIKESNDLNTLDITNIFWKLV